VIFFIADQTRFMAQQNAEILARQGKSLPLYIDNQLMNLVALDCLPYVNDAQGDQHSGCLKGTRKDILNQITQWAVDRNAKPIFCLVDQAGTGKSTISAQMVHQWGDDHSLVSRFFFSKPKAITSGEDFASTVATDMAIQIPLLRAIIIKVLNGHSKISTYSIEKNMELLVITPLKKLKEERTESLSAVQKEMQERAHMEEQEWISGDKLDKAAIEQAKVPYLEALKAVEKDGRDSPLLEALETTYMTYLETLEQSLTDRPILAIDSLDECAEGDCTNILQSLRHMSC
jgi:hypothetical protein